MTDIDDLDDDFYENDWHDFIMEEPTEIFAETLTMNRSEDWLNGFNWGYLMAQRDCFWDYFNLKEEKKQEKKKRKRKGKRK